MFAARESPLVCYNTVQSPFPSQVLHDAFFKYQTKPKLSGPGDMYYEGKEFEAAITHAQPGAAAQGRSAGLAVVMHWSLTGNSMPESCTSVATAVYSAAVPSSAAGVLSPALQEALGVTEGSPPPWLVNMQVRSDARLINGLHMTIFAPCCTCEAPPDCLLRRSAMVRPPATPRSRSKASMPPSHLVPSLDTIQVCR